MKKFLSIFLVVCLMAGVMVGCGSNKTTETDKPAGNTNEATQTAKPNGKTEVNLWHYWDGQNQNVLKEYADEFNAQSDNIQVNVSYIPYGEYTQKVLTAAAGGQVPDILVYSNNETAILAEAGVLGVVTDTVKNGGYEERVLPEVLKSHEYNGEYYGLPIYGNCLALFYNKDMVETPPATWEALMKIAPEVTTPDCYALAFSAVENEEGSFQFLPWLWSAGADLGTLDSEEGIAALTLYKDLVDNGYVSKEVVGWTQQDAMLQFASGRAAMMVNGPWQVAALAAESPDLNYGVAVLPALEEGGSASILGGESFGIAAGGNVEAASEFINWIFSEQNYADFVRKVGQLPAEEKMLMDPYYQNDPIQKAFADNLMVAKPRAYGPEYNEMSKALQTAITATLSGISTPEQAAKDAAAVINPLLNK